MNEKVDVNNIIEVVNVGQLNNKVKREGGIESDEDHPQDEEEVKYHESIINDIYGSMSDSEEDEEDDEDGEPSVEKQNKRLKREARKLQEELKAKEEREQMQNAGIGEYLNKQVKEKVGQIFEQAKAKYQSDFNQEKVKGMFNNAYSKFNDIVQKNNIQLPSIAELTQPQPKPHKTSLDQYLKTSHPEQKKTNNQTQETNKEEGGLEIKQESQGQQKDKGEEKLEKKKTHFKINDGGETNEVSEKEDESDGEEFQDSEDEPEKQQEKQKENKINDPLTQQMHQVTLQEEQKTLLTEDSLNPKSTVTESSQHQRRSSWEERLVKGQEIDVSEIKLFQCKKESEKKNVLYQVSVHIKFIVLQMVFNYETRYLSVINGTLYSFELINTQPALPFINNKDINTQNIKNLASRFFQSSKTKLFSYGSKQPSEQAEVAPQVVEEPPQIVPQQDPNVKKKAKLKGKIQLSRLFMIDITERGKKEIEIIMHFVNKHRNPLESPEIKRYRMNVDAETQLFLVTLEESIQRESEYYQIVMKENSQRRNERECSLCVFNGYQYCLGECYDLGDECLKSTPSIYISECTGTNSTNSQCFQNYTITNADAGVTNYINVNLDDTQWCYVMIQDNMTAKYLKNTIANWVLNTNTTAFVMYLEAQTPTVNSTVLKDMNVSDDSSFLQSMTSGINNMVSNYTHVIFAINPNNNQTPVLFSIQYTSGILLRVSEAAYLQIYQIPAAKALVGAALIQYLIYSVIYIIEGFKLQEFESGLKPKVTKKKAETNGGTQQPDQEEQKDQKPTNLKDIALEEENNEESTQNIPSTVIEPTKVTDPTKLEDEEDNSFEMPFLMMVPQHYQKSTIWFMVALGICAVRTPCDLTIAVAYIQVLFRLIQLIGAILHKRRVSQIAYILASICTLILFFAAMLHGGSVEVLPNE